MKQRGLTLVEVLVALGIFAAVSAIGVAALGLAVNGSRQLDEASERIGDVERMRGLLRGDLYQLADRKVFEPDTDVARPAFMGGDALATLLEEEDGEALLALVRAGYANPGAREPRGELQAVVWLQREGALVRRTRPYLDAVRETPVRDDVLLTGLEEVTVEFLADGRWRPSAGGPNTPGRPDAVRLRFVHADYGAMEHVFLVGGPE